MTRASLNDKLAACQRCGAACHSSRARFCSVVCGNRSRPRRSAADRLWAKVERRGPDECWPWIGAHNGRSGHGQFMWPHMGRRLIGAHRAVWILTFGPITDPALEVCHKCDHGECCNPDHLFLGTHMDNMQDALHKGRMKFPPVRCGEKNNKAKLTTDAVVAVRAAYAAGETLSDMSRRLGMARSTLREVVKGRNWRSVDCPAIPRQAPTRKLTDEQVSAIRAEHAAGATQVSIAGRYGINQAYVSELVNYKSRYVPAEPQPMTLEASA